MPKKSKPKQRTNWKQRALLCEEVIGAQNELAKAREAKVRTLDVTIAMQNYELDYKGRDLVGLQDEIEKLTARAESAEKHNALLLEERADTVKCSYCDAKFNRFADGHHHVCRSRKCVGRYYAEYSKEQVYWIGANPPTHWQRFKSYFMAGLRGE